MNRLRKKTFKPMTKVMSKLQSELLPAADYTIVGSDQTWNPAVTSSNAMAYFLDFVPETSKRIALSASFGTAEWHQKELIDKVSSELAKFHKISVREPSGVQICKNYFGELKEIR
jgi:hypothetical protein